MASADVGHGVDGSAAPDREAASPEGPSESAQRGSAQSQGAQSQGAQSQGAQSQGAQSQGAQREGAQSQGAQSQGAQSEGAAGQDEPAGGPTSGPGPSRRFNIYEVLAPVAQRNARQLPKLVLNAVRLVWSAARRELC